MARLCLLFVCVIGVVLLGVLSGSVSLGYLVPFSGINAQLWYAGLKKPIDVPSIVFPIAWAFLYTLMGVSLWLVLSARRTAGDGNLPRYRAKALELFSFQLLLSLLWPAIFFGLRLPSVALLEMAALLAFIALYIRASHKVNRTAAYLMIPYAIWAVFAMVLNLTIVMMN
jgi:benzodiazapine receptor